MNVPQRATELAEGLQSALDPDELGISHIDAVKGYLNLYFSTAEYARRVVDTVLLEDGDYGRGAESTRR